MLSARQKLGLLSALYCAEGLPFGFQAMALPVYLREQRVSLEQIGFASALALPWMLKALWAPLVERWSWPRLGRRKTWIVPALLLLIHSAFTAAALVWGLGEAEALRGLLVVVFVQNMAAATMDIAVDGLAVDLLERDELGVGNSAQVVGYKVGMLGSGGLLLWLAGALGGWPALFVLMALALIAVTALAVWLLRPEPEPAPAAVAARPSLGEVLRTLGRAVAVPGGAWLVLYLSTYKLGETVIDHMYKPLLVDLGASKEQIGRWVGTWGMLCGTLGSLLGGVAASRFGLWRAMAAAALLRTLSLLGPWSLAQGVWARWPLETVVVPITCLEELCGGALTTATFAFMMSRTDKRVGATHYTLLASLEVWGKGLAAFGSGVLAGRLGYGPAFGVAVLVSVGLLPLLLTVGREPAAQAPAQAA